MVHSKAVGLSIPSQLVARLESATVGSRELDEEIAELLCSGKYRTCIAGLSDEQGGMWMYEFEGHSASSALRVTTSLDAALALAERVLPEPTIRGLPGRTTRLSQRLNGTWEAATYRVFDGRTHHAVAATSALALCIAILKALSDKPADEDRGCAGTERSGVRQTNTDRQGDEG